MRTFTCNLLPSRVLFGSGMRNHLADELQTLGLQRVLVLSTPGRHTLARSIASNLGVRSAGIYAQAAMHAPVAITEAALRSVAALRIDGLVAVGGGSAIGLGKAIAARNSLPQLVLPTTYAGSEMTPIFGETKDGVKATRADPKVQPRVVVYDVDLTLTLSAKTSAASGMNAIAHAVEALYARDHNPVTSLLASEGIRVMARALPGITGQQGEGAARFDALYGAWLCGICLGSVGMALHHKLCHALGGAFDLPHAETHAIVLPHVLAYNWPCIPEAIDELQAILGDDPALALFELAGRAGVPRALNLLGMPEAGIDLVATRTLENPYWNPRPLEYAGLRSLLQRAWAGEPPASASRE